METLVCVFFLFCSTIVGGDIPNEPGKVSYINNGLNVILAHNHLDGRHFSEMEVGDMIRVYDNGWTEYKVTEIIAAQAETPESDQTRLFIDGRWMTPTETYQRIFWGYNTITLMTCIEKDGNWSWGRLFVTGERHDIR